MWISLHLQTKAFCSKRILPLRAEPFLNFFSVLKLNLKQSIKALIAPYSQRTSWDFIFLRKGVEIRNPFYFQKKNLCCSHLYKNTHWSRRNRAMNKKMKYERWLTVPLFIKCGDSPKSPPDSKILKHSISDTCERNRDQKIVACPIAEDCPDRTHSMQSEQHLHQAQASWVSQVTTREMLSLQLKYPKLRWLQNGYKWMKHLSALCGHRNNFTSLIRGIRSKWNIRDRHSLGGWVLNFKQLFFSKWNCMFVK